MIEATVHFGNNNSYIIDLHESTYLGLLPPILTKPLGKRPHDLLYIICNGVLLGSPFLGYAPGNRLYDIPLTSNVNGTKTCSIYLVLRPHNIGTADTLIQSRFDGWLSHQSSRASHSADLTINGTSIPLPNTDMMHALNLMTSGNTYEALVRLADVPVVIPTENLNSFILPENTQASPHTCFCGESTESGDLSKIIACGHIFHTECIATWLTTRDVKCPLCNRDVRQSDHDPTDADHQ